MKEKRILWIDGLRGAACFFIVLHHFMMGYYPAVCKGAQAAPHFQGGWEAGLAQSPLSVFITGDFWVSVFCLVSGLVIARQVFGMKDSREYARALLKRYPRLMLPVFALSAVVFVMYRAEVFYNVQAAAYSGSEWLAEFYLEETSLSGLFMDSLVNTWIVGMVTQYSNAFWMMGSLFAGSYMAYLLAAMAHGLNRKVVLVYLFVAGMYCSVNSRLACFALGVLLSYLLEEYQDGIEAFGKKWKGAGVVMLLSALLLGGYPVFCEPDNAYRYLDFLPGNLECSTFYHLIGACLLVAGIYLLRPLQTVLSSKPLLFLGKTSYSVYVIHIPVLFSFSAWLLVKLFGHTRNYPASAALMLAVSLPVILLLGWLFYEGVEKNCSRLTDCLTEKLTEGEAGGEKR